MIDEFFSDPAAALSVIAILSAVFALGAIFIPQRKLAFVSFVLMHFTPLPVGIFLFALAKLAIGALYSGECVGKYSFLIALPFVIWFAVVVTSVTFFYQTDTRGRIVTLAADVFCIVLCIMIWFCLYINPEFRECTNYL